MSVSNVGGGNSDLYQFLQNLAGNQSSNTTSPPDGADGTLAGTLQQTGGRHHHRGGGQLLNQIAGAVNTALQGADSGTTDVNTVITNAIAGVLQGQSGATTTGATPTTAAAGATSSSGSPGDQLGQLLSSLGVTPQQFWSDFDAAVQQIKAQGPAAATTTGDSALSGLTPGSVLDTTA